MTHDPTTLDPETDVDHYPPQDTVAEWWRTFVGDEPLPLKVLGLMGEVGHLSRAVKQRELTPQYDLSKVISTRLGAIMLTLLDVADQAGVDLATATRRRFDELDRRGPQEDTV